MKKVFLFALLLSLTLSLCACGSTVFYSYADASRYTAGGTVITGPADSLEIDWIDGSVTVAYHQANTVEIAETAQKNLSDAEKLQWWLDGTTLRVKYAKSDSLVSSDLKKSLTITLPENTSAPLKKVEISSISGSIHCHPLYAENVKLSAISGSVDAECAADELKISTISGKITLAASANEIKLSSTSGAVEADIGHAEKVEINGTSGAISLTGTEIKKADIDSISGPVNAALQKTESLEVSAISGAIRLSLPDDLGFTADFSTVSGSLNNDLSAQRTGNRLVQGDGGAKISVSTVSGSLTLAAYQEK